MYKNNTAVIVSLQYCIPQLFFHISWSPGAQLPIQANTQKEKKILLHDAFIEVLEKTFITKFTFVVFLITSHSLPFNQSHKFFLSPFSLYVAELKEQQ